MKRMLEVGLGVALACTVGCGGSAPKKEWTEMSTSASASPDQRDDAASASAAPEGPPESDAAEGARLDAAVDRAQSRLTQAPELIGLMNPMGGHVDIPEAARRTSQAIAGVRADQGVFSGIADRLAGAHADLAKAPSPAVIRLARAAAYRFREWALLQLLLATEKTAKDLLASSSSPSTPAILMAAVQLDGLKYGHEGALLLHRYLAVAPEALRRAARCHGELEVARLLYDTRLMATAWGPTQWTEHEVPDVTKWVAEFRAATATLPPPGGAPIARMVTRWWDWGAKATGNPMEPADLVATAADLRALKPLMPPSAEGLESMAAEGP